MKYDALIIGAGHNGLVCAFYLARAGLKVRVVERLAQVGGAAVTEEFAPGFRNSVQKKGRPFDTLREVDEGQAKTNFIDTKTKRPPPLLAKASSNSASANSGRV